MSLVGKRTISKSFLDGMLSVAVMAALGFSNTALAEDQWQLVKEKDGIKVYTQPVAGSDFLEFKGETDLDANLPQCAGLTMSIAHMPKWMFGTKRAELVSSVTDLDRVIYMVQHAPFPLKDRDLYVHNTLTQNSDHSVVYTMDLMPEKAENNSYVHVERLHTRVTLTALSANKTHVEYRAHIDPGGKVPSWAANIVVTDTPFETLKAAKKTIAETKDSLVLDSIKNPY